jgi:hypothetical protein
MEAYEVNGEVDGVEVFNGMERFYIARDFLRQVCACECV